MPFSNMCILWQVACVLMFYLQKDDFPVHTHAGEYSFLNSFLDLLLDHVWP
jgi:hypothetical protein